ASGPPAKVSVVGLSQVVFAMALEAVFSAEVLTPAKLLGTVLVMAPTAWLLLQRQLAPEIESLLPEPAPVAVGEGEAPAAPVPSSRLGGSLAPPDRATPPPGSLTSLTSPSPEPLAVGAHTPPRVCSPSPFPG